MELSQVAPTMVGPNLDLIALSEAIDRLEAKDPRAASIVKLRYFTGLTFDQVAAALGIASSTARLDWNYAKNWLRAELVGEANG